MADTTEGREQGDAGDNAPGLPGAEGGEGQELVLGVAPRVAARTLEPVAEGAQRGRWRVWREGWEVYAGNRLALVSLVFLVLVVLFCFVGPLIYKTNQSSATIFNASLSPSSQFPLGTSPEGFDVLGRLMYGGQSTLELGFVVAVLATGFGALWGALAGYIGGVVDSILMRIVDTMLSIPFLFLAVLIATLLSPSLWLIIGAITAVSWQSTARIVRGETLSLRTRDFVTAATGFGSWHLRLVGRHVLPNTIGSIVVNATLQVATAILLFAALSFLGLNVPPPATSWGRTATMGISSGAIENGHWWELWPAAAAIILTVIAVSLIGDGLYDVVARRASADKTQ